jgi:hypothetical protein
MARHHRRASSFRRPEASRDPYDYVLIVCEGSKTEPHYLAGLKVAHGLSNANIKVTPADGTDPISILEFAQRELARDTAYDRVFCVFDRNGHHNYDEALQRIAALGQDGKITAITSWPCFEIWVLLHFIETTAPFEASGGRSSCDNALRKVQEHYDRYTKGRHGVYDELKGREADAIKRADRLVRHNQDTNTTNPSTRMHELVRYLRSVKKP